MQKDDVRMQQHWHAMCECGNAGTPPCKSLGEKKACFNEYAQHGGWCREVMFAYRGLKRHV